MYDSDIQQECKKPILSSDDVISLDNLNSVLLSSYNVGQPSYSIILEKKAKERGFRVWREAFLDRGYTDQGQLQYRGEPGAILKTSKAMYAQLKSISQNKHVQTVSGNWIPMEADTFCLHGDHPRVVQNLKELLKLNSPTQ